MPAGWDTNTLETAAYSLICWTRHYDGQLAIVPAGVFDYAETVHAEMTDLVWC